MKGGKYDGTYVNVMTAVNVTTLALANADFGLVHVMVRAQWLPHVATDIPTYVHILLGIYI